MSESKDKGIMNLVAPKATKQERKAAMGGKRTKGDAAAKRAVKRK